MIRLNIINMREFLHVVNGCSGAVELLYPDGTKRDINKQYSMQVDLQRKHRENRNYMQLALNIPNARDYEKIVFFTVGDC